MIIIAFGVNLPRWGLKLDENPENDWVISCVNLPRWGLKPAVYDIEPKDPEKCKFTPLGFET